MTQRQSQQASMALVARITLFSGLVLVFSGAVVWLIGVRADPANSTLVIAGLLVAGFGVLEALTSLLLRLGLRAGAQRADQEQKPPGMI